MGINNEKGEAVTIVVILTALTIAAMFGVVEYEDHLARKRDAEKTRAVQVEQQIDWEKLPHEGELR